MARVEPLFLILTFIFKNFFRINGELSIDEFQLEKRKRKEGETVSARPE